MGAGKKDTPCPQRTARLSSCTVRSAPGCAASMANHAGQDSAMGRVCTSGEQPRCPHTPKKFDVRGRKAEQLFRSSDGARLRNTQPASKSTKTHPRASGGIMREESGGRRREHRNGRGVNSGPNSGDGNAKRRRTHGSESNGENVPPTWDWLRWHFAWGVGTIPMLNLNGQNLRSPGSTTASACTTSGEGGGARCVSFHEKPAKEARLPLEHKELEGIFVHREKKRKGSELGEGRRRDRAGGCRKKMDASRRVASHPTSNSAPAKAAKKLGNKRPN
ncbi:hypothetical protein C8J57DRAFT_1254522 [Mycena rebaudengoi]|nr:hypothetical protein C8J57DRAFT_1254522 [Mycena rebaudengoi]